MAAELPDWPWRPWLLPTSTEERGLGVNCKLGEFLHISEHKLSPLLLLLPDLISVVGFLDLRLPQPYLDVTTSVM